MVLEQGIYLLIQVGVKQGCPMSCLLYYKVTQPGFEPGTTPNCGGALPTELPGHTVSTTGKPYIEILHSE
jgi:hypothetical protein